MDRNHLMIDMDEVDSIECVPCICSSCNHKFWTHSSYGKHINFCPNCGISIKIKMEVNK